MSSDNEKQDTNPCAEIALNNNPTQSSLYCDDGTNFRQDPFSHTTATLPWNHQGDNLTPDERKELEDLELDRKTTKTKKKQKDSFRALTAEVREKMIGAMDVIDIMNDLEFETAEKTEREQELQGKKYTNGMIDMSDIRGMRYPFGVTRTFQEGIGRLTKQELIDIHAQQVIEEALNDAD